MFEDNVGLSYSFHLSNDKNKTQKAKQKAKQNTSGVTSFSNNAIQNINDLGKVNHHNLRQYDNKQELIKTIKGTNNIVSDVKELYLSEFEESKIEYNSKQTREDRKIDNYFYKISNDTKHDLACEIIIELGNMTYWNKKNQEEKYKMIEVFKEQIKDLESIVPNFKIANATIHFDESSPHLHIIGVPVKNDCKTGMSKQVGKTSVFTKESLQVIQDKMRECCINSYNKICGLNMTLKPKQKGRNQDISSKDMEQFNSKKNELKKNISILKNEVKNLEVTKQDISKEVNKLEDTKEVVNKEIEDKRKYNSKIILKDKAKLIKENEELKQELNYEKQLHYQYETMYNSLKEKTDYLINQLRKVLDKVPIFIKTIVERLFIYNDINLKFFKQQYDQEVIKKQELEQQKNRRIFKSIQKEVPLNKETVSKENKNKDDFEMNL